MNGMDSVLVTYSTLDVGLISASVTSPCTGATSLFVGTTRDNFGGRKVVNLEYEAYEGMATKELAKLCVDLRSRWGNLHKIAIHHRLGEVKVTEASVVIAISSPHRKESLEAVHYCIDQLKATVPIWKKEIYEDEEGGTWKENQECSWTGGSSRTTDGEQYNRDLPA